MSNAKNIFNENRMLDGEFDKINLSNLEHKGSLKNGLIHLTILALT